MEYSNPEIPEGINYSKSHPLREFALLAGGVLAVIFIGVLLLGIFADHFAQYIPYRVEKNFRVLVPAKDDGPPVLHAYLDALADRIVAAEELPEGMNITVHYIDSDTVNAYATLGGHIVLYRGLLEKLRNENALAMVMAHEIAHIKYRHVIRSMGGGLVVGIALSMLNSSLGNEVVNSVINQTAQVGILRFSRAHETQADIVAVNALQSMYGSLAGAEELFVAIREQETGIYAPVFLRTHPGTDERIQRIRNWRYSHGQPDARKIKLPADFRKWLRE
ncbi:MAG: M48 family metalloprotease [Gammaproteobacteria bacterium]|nr:M48 family metalloprotease [Gammaproteobacteria bacterium]